MNNFVENYSIMKSISERLETYIKYINSSTHQQNSSIWLEQRKLSVGCSELYKACGTPKQRQDIINNKVNGCNLSRINPIIWGHVFETSTKLLCNLILNTNIHTLGGSIKHHSKVVSCSPDGVGILRVPVDMVNDLITQKVEDHYKYKKRVTIVTDKILNPAIRIDSFTVRNHDWSPTIMTDKNYYDEVELIALYEFKSPYSRELDHSKVDPGYLFQVLGGIEIIRPVYNIGVLAEARFEQSSPLEDINLGIYDQHRGTTNTIYFGSCKYIVMKDNTATAMVPLELEFLHGKRVTEDYEVVDGPYFFRYGDKVIFNENGFIDRYEVPEYNTPTDINSLNMYFKVLNNYLESSKSKPHYYCTYQLKAMSIKYIAGLEGFIDMVKPYCADIINEVKQRR